MDSRIIIPGKKVVAESSVLDTSAFVNGDYVTSLVLPEILPKFNKAARIEGYFIPPTNQGSMRLLFFGEMPVISSAINAPLDISTSEMVNKFIVSLSITALNSVNSAIYSFGVSANGIVAPTSSLYVVVQATGGVTFSANQKLSLIAISG